MYNEINKNELYQRITDAINSSNLPEVVAVLNIRPLLYFDQYSILHSAAGLSSVEVLEYLLDHRRADLNAIHDGDTPLATATRMGMLENVQCLVRRGAALGTHKIMMTEEPNPRALGRYRFVHQCPLLHLAATMSRMAIADYLLQQGCVLDAVDDHGWSALHMAARFNHLDFVRFLMARGANPFLKNNDGKTPLDCARKCTGLPNTQAIVELLDVPFRKQKFLYFSLGLHRRAGQESYVSMLAHDVIGLIHDHLMLPPPPPRP